MAGSTVIWASLMPEGTHMPDGGARLVLTCGAFTDACSVWHFKPTYISLP